VTLIREPEGSDDGLHVPRGRVAIALAGLLGMLVIVTVLAALAPGSPGSDTSSATPAPTVSGLYGPGIGMDSLNNTVVGGSDSAAAAYRFRASTSAPLSSIRIYIMGPKYAGYGAGTGGTWQVTVQTDDGTERHAPSGTVLATTSFTPSEVFPVISWSSPASLATGRLYHIVFTNVDADPAANYASVNGIFMYQPTTPRQAAFSDTDWGQQTRSGDGGWSESPSTVPIMQLSYANGVIAGEGYMEVWIRSAKAISGSAMAREAFTVSGPNRSVNSFSVRLMRISGSSPLTVRLENADGALIEQGTIAAASIAIGAPGDHRGSGHATWETYAFSASRILASGHAYDVVVSTAADTEYSIFVIMQGSKWGFAAQTFFADGHAQYTSGSSWEPFTEDGDGALDESDLQFYFR